MSTPRKTPSKHARPSVTPSRLPPRRGATPVKRTTTTTTPRKTPHNSPMRKEENNQGEEGIQVAIRMRPLNRKEQERHRVWKVLPKYSSVTQTTTDGQPLPERITGRTFFSYDKTFGEEASTQQVYDSVAKTIVSSAVTGLNGTIFAYGQTSSGKTFTMQGSGTIEEGTTDGSGGVVHLASRDIFTHIHNKPDRIFLVRASFLEIYNEEVRDLLTDDNRTLQIREDPRRGVFVQSQEEIVTNFESLLEILFRGEKSRAFASTAMNERSSRSHTIFRITIESREKPSESVSDDEDEKDGAVLISTLNLVDLAGSESVRHTGATGDRQKEGGMINQSLLTLSRVIVALGSPNQAHINFRDSKLTRLLQPSLSGNARMAVICCATPSELYLEETRSTLLFASRAKLVKTRAQVNEVLDDRSLIKRLQRELAEAKRVGGGGASNDHVKALEQQVEHAGEEAKKAEAKLRRLQASFLNAGVNFQLGAATNLQIVAVGNKRRLSEGYLKMQQYTPEKAAQKYPLTMPRPTKKNKLETTVETSEVGLLRDALRAKALMVETVQREKNESLRLLSTTEAELVAMSCSNDILRSERDDAKQRAILALSELGSIKAEAQASAVTFAADLEAKVSMVEQMKAQLGRELNDRRVLEEAVDSLQDDKVALQREFELERSDRAETVKSLQLENEKLRNSFHFIIADKEVAIREVESLSIDKQSRENEISALETRNKDFVDLLSTTKKQLVRAGMARDSEARALTKQVEVEMRLETSNAGLLSSLAETRSERDSILAELVDVKVNAAEQLAIHHHTVQSLGEATTSIKHLSETIEQLETKCTMQNEELSEGKLQLANNAAENETLSSLLEVCRVDVTAIRAEKLELVEKLSESFAHAAKVTQELTEANTNLVVAGKQILELETVIAEVSIHRDDASAGWEKSKSYLEDAQQRINELSGLLEVHRAGELSALAREKNMIADRELAASTAMDLKETTRNLEKQLADKKICADEMSLFLADAEARNAAYATEVCGFKDALRNLTQETESLNLRLREAEKETHNAEESFDKKILALSTQLETSEGNADALQKRLEIALASVDSLTTHCHTLMIKCNQQVNAIDELEAQLYLCSKETSAIIGDRHAAFVQIAELNSEVSALLNKVASYEKNAAESEGALVAASNNVQVMAVQMEDLNSQLEDYSSTLRSQSEKLSFLQPKLDELERERDLCLARSAELADSLAEWKRQAEEGELRNHLSDQKVTALLAEVEENVKQTTQSDRRLLEAQSQVEELLQSNLALREDLQNVQDAHRELTAEAESRERWFESLVENHGKQIAKLESELEVADAKGSALSLELAAREKVLLCTKVQLLSSQEDYEKAETRLDKANRRATDMEREFESSVTLLKKSIESLEREKNFLSNEQRCLQASNATLEKEVKQHDAQRLARPTPLLSGGEMATEIIDLKQLLADSNRLNDEIRTKALKADVELREKNIQLEEMQEKLTQCDFDREDSRSASMSNEALQTGLRRIDALNTENSCLRVEIEKSQIEANATRKELAEVNALVDYLEKDNATLSLECERLSSESSRHVDSVIQVESRVAALENENARLKRALNRLEANNDSNFLNMTTDFERTRVELDTISRLLTAREAQLEKSREECVYVSRELSSQVERAAGIEGEHRILEEANATLKLQYLAAESQLEETKKKVAHFARKLQTRDDRIAKLEKVKLTKEQVAQMKKLRADHAEAEKALVAARIEIEDLKASMASVSASEAEGSEISTLQFAKHALENKLRKYVSHCQRLEDEKAEILDVLRSGMHAEIEKRDIGKTIVSICDRIASLEEECEAYSKSGSRSANSFHKVEQLENANKAILGQVAEFSAKVKRFQQNESDLKAKIASLQLNHAALVQELDAARTSAEETAEASSLKIRHLEQENLQLMIDLKSAKKHLQNARSELNMLRAKAFDDVTVSLGKPPQLFTQPDKTNIKHERTSTPARKAATDKENAENSVQPSSSKLRRKLGSTSKAFNAPGLGEAFPETEENTQECKQS